MESKYDRVAYPENVYLHSDCEQEEFGTGVYPGVSIISRHKRRDDTIKIACFRIQRRLSFFLVIGGVLVLLLVCIIAVLASGSKVNLDHNESGGKNVPIIKNTNDKSLDYSDVKQSDSHLIDCSNGTTPSKNFACKFPVSQFGEECTREKNFGFKAGRPCILLSLKLNETMKPIPFEKESDVASKILKSRWSSTHVGLSCDGVTQADRNHISTDHFVSPSGKPEDNMEYQPVSGFPTAFFPKMSDKYITPAVMVQFTVMFNRYVDIKCVAWASNFNKGKPESTELYTAKFLLYVGK
ncbi:hypothetical protein FSP39_025309 [Pinctada imbricata]|uniref:Uncharacterized protein n=1 Tax=Pinctada imbricata TaxID=66713 RepID=A0AA89BS57_PINIB|nr:hypothetical protein FSP39_025309 [Pinctada imbricata]